MEQEDIDYWYQLGYKTGYNHGFSDGKVGVIIAAGDVQPKVDWNKFFNHKQEVVSMENENGI